MLQLAATLMRATLETTTTGNYVYDLRHKTGSKSICLATQPARETSGLDSGSIPRVDERDQARQPHVREFLRVFNFTSSDATQSRSYQEHCGHKPELDDFSCCLFRPNCISPPALVIQRSNVAGILRMFSSYTTGLARNLHIHDVDLGNVNGRGSTLEDIHPMSVNHDNQPCQQSLLPHTSPPQ
jgi:hypothetical protein